MLKLTSVCLLFFLFVAAGKAQTISVSNFYLNETDLTANQTGTTELDHNGDKCALIRVQTTQKGFVFEVGSMGVTKLIEKTGEIWVYISPGTKHISIRHAQLGSLSNYIFPVSIRGARTYMMDITTDQVFTNTYDSSRTQTLIVRVTPPDATFILNGGIEALDSLGRLEKKVALGTYTYKVDSPFFFPKEDQITIDNDDPNTPFELVVDSLRPRMGKLSLHLEPYDAEVLIDGVKQERRLSALDPYDVQIGKHEVHLSAPGYREETFTVTVEEDRTADYPFELTKRGIYTFTSSPAEAEVTINGEYKGKAPVTEDLPYGKYNVHARKFGSEDYNEIVEINSTVATVRMVLHTLYNIKSFYLEGGARAGSYTAFGATAGFYLSNFNVEGSYFYGTDKSETIYWNSQQARPISSVYSPGMTITGKVGYGIAVGTRMRITPQIGVNALTLTEKADGGDTQANGSNVMSALLSVRFSLAFNKSMGFSLSPEYAVGVMKSEGYEVLSGISSKIKKWGEGFNVKVGLIIML